MTVTARRPRSAEWTAAARRVQGGAALLLVLLAALALSLGPRHVYLNGQRFPLHQAPRVADAAALLGVELTPGDLHDVRGGRLVRGGGLPAVLLRNGEPVEAQARLRGGDVLTILPPRPLTEPTESRLLLLEPGPLRGGRPLASGALVGMRREVWGRFSEQPAQIHIAQVQPLPPPGAGEGRLIALTFDDGPNPVITPQLLEALEAHGAQGTFFVLGSLAARHPDLVRRIHAGGHELAVHSWGHPHYTKWDSGRIVADLHRCVDGLRGILGHPIPITWVRPPYGATDARVKAAIESGGLQQALWDVDTNDWRRPGAQAIARHVLARARPGAVVLMHDGGGPREGTLAAVRIMLPQLKERGYRPVTLSRLRGKQADAPPAIFTISGRSFLVQPTAPPMSVQIDGVDLPLPTPVLKCEGQLLIPALPALRLLGAAADYETETQTLLVEAATGSYRLPVQSLGLERNGREAPLQAPTLLYANKAYVSVTLATRITGASALLDTQDRVLRLFSAGAGLTGAGPAAQASRWIAVAGVPEPGL